MAPRRYSRDKGKLFHEKTLKTKISCQTPFKLYGGNVIQLSTLMQSPEHGGEGQGHRQD
jgi:hypothetical protein